MQFFNVKKKLGFGFMRLPQSNGQTDYEQLDKMVDLFIGKGFNYFDTAHGYHSGMSEVAIKKCVSDRYPRDSFVLTNKLSGDYFKKNEDIRPLFASQLAACGVDCFDFYLMHAQNANNFKHYVKCGAYEEAFKLKEEGKIKHVGISFHDTAAVLEDILTKYPQIEVVQIQYNYLDYDDPAIESGKCLKVCEKFNKPAIIMEPIKGGSLARLIPEAQKVIDALGVTPANLALRFAAMSDNVMMVLSGMSTLEQLEENVGFMDNYKPLEVAELSAAARIASIIRKRNIIACTACRYCVDGCPKKIKIPDLFACYNARKHFNDWNANYYYLFVHTAEGGKASDCIGCGKCEASCPQKLNIRDLLRAVAKEFEK